MALLAVSLSDEISSLLGSINDEDERRSVTADAAVAGMLEA